MKKKTQIIATTLICLLATACQTFKNKSSNSLNNTNQASLNQWDAKAMIKNLETGEASVVSLDVLGIKPQNLRMEVTSTLGIALASIVIKGQNVEYILPKQKRYYHGSSSDLALYPALKIKVNPSILSTLFFEEPYPQWDCQADNGLLVACETPEGLKIKWERENDLAKRILVNGPLYEVQVQIKNHKIRNEVPEKAWVINIPTEFKKYRLK